MQLFSYLVTTAINNLVIFVFINFILNNSKVAEKLQCLELSILICHVVILAA